LKENIFPLVCLYIRDGTDTKEHNQDTSLDAERGQEGVVAVLPKQPDVGEDNDMSDTGHIDNAPRLPDESQKRPPPDYM
jgi:hypothetical protein